MKILVALAISVLALGKSLGEAQMETLNVPFTKGAIEVDPLWNGWEAVRAIDLTINPQDQAIPWNLNPSTKTVSVKAVHNGSWIAFLLTWKDATKDAVMHTDKFRDAVAVMVPVAESTDIAMGEPGGRGLILHWKADWQEDIDKGFQDIAQLYPNAWTDWYPFVPGEPPYDITAWTNPEARRYMTGWVVGNPRSQPQKRVSVEEQVAEGFGSLTTTPRQNAIGKGVYANGEWKVVIARPFAAGDPNDPSWGPGKKTLAAFAVWDGAKGEIGARKGYVDWVPMTVRPIGGR
jgi:hypothetical protein